MLDAVTSRQNIMRDYMYRLLQVLYCMPYDLVSVFRIFSMKSYKDPINLNIYQ